MAEHENYIIDRDMSSLAADQPHQNYSKFDKRFRRVIMRHAGHKNGHYQPAVKSSLCYVMMRARNTAAKEF